MNRLTNIILAIAAGLLLLCCQKEDGGGTARPESGPDATLSISLDTKSASDPYQEWSQWERAVDGRYLYRVTAFLLQDSRLVAVKDLDLSGEDEPAEAYMSFDGNFVHGKYTLMVVANYSAHTADDGENGVKTYAGLDGFSSTVGNILNTSGVLENFTSTYAESFFNFRLASEEGLCPKVPQPLTLVKEIELHPGTNVIEGELLRTYSRIKIAIENQSDEELKVGSLDFSDLFTQTRAYLFHNKGKLSERTSINVAHSHAITPFDASEASPVVIAGKSTEVIFDAYILESRKEADDEQYSYSLGLGYGESDIFKVKSTTAINSPSGIGKGHYLIYNARRGRYLKAGSSRVESGTLSQLAVGTEISKEYVWALDNTGLSGNQYYIGTPEILQGANQTGYYMAQTSSNSISLNSLLDAKYAFTFNQYRYDSVNYLSIRSSSSNNNMYLQVSNNGSVTGTRSTGNSTMFYLYELENAGLDRYDIALRTISDQDGQAYDVEEIDRNDFINILVTASFNENTGHFTFEVKDWENGGGDVSFN